MATITKTDVNKLRQDIIKNNITDTELEELRNLENQPSDLQIISDLIKIQFNLDKSEAYNKIKEHLKDVRKLFKINYPDKTNRYLQEITLKSPVLNKLMYYLTSAFSQDVFKNSSSTKVLELTLIEGNFLSSYFSTVNHIVRTTDVLTRFSKVIRKFDIKSSGSENVIFIVEYADTQYMLQNNLRDFIESIFVNDYVLFDTYKDIKEYIIDWLLTKDTFNLSLIYTEIQINMSPQNIEELERIVSRFTDEIKLASILKSQLINIYSPLKTYLKEIERGILNSILAGKIAIAVENIISNKLEKIIYVRNKKIMEEYFTGIDIGINNISFYNGRVYGNEL